jgi:hypothetical protein
LFPCCCFPKKPPAGKLNEILVKSNGAGAPLNQREQTVAKHDEMNFMKRDKDYDYG